MKYIITQDTLDPESYIMRTKTGNWIVAILVSDMMSDEIKDYIERDDYVEVSLTPHLG